MATVVGFVSEKGGVGKTTACYHIAVALRRYHAKRVLVVDTDYQRGGITARFRPELLESFNKGRVSGRTLFGQFQLLYSAQTPDLKVDLLTTSEGIKLLPADPRMSQVSHDKLPGERNIRENNRLLLAHLSLIRKTLEPLVSGFDYVLIDSHPETSDLLRCVVFASDYCVSPVKLDLQSSVGVVSAQQAINEVNEDVRMIAGPLREAEDHEPTIFAGSIAMMTREYDGDLKASERPQYRRLEMAGPVFKNYVTQGDGINKAAAERCPVYDVSGPNAEKQARQFRSITEEFLERCP